MDPLEVGTIGCGLDGSGDVEIGNPRRLVTTVVAVEAMMQGMEPRGRTLWFYRGDGCEKTNRSPRSPCLP